MKIKPVLPPEKNFYAKRLDYEEIPIKSSIEVSDEALLAAWARLNMMLCKEPNIAANLSLAGAQLHIIGKDQSTSDLPENRHLKGSLIEGVDIDARTRGLGGLLASCGEENLLRSKHDRYHGRDICVHEFAHTILNYGLCEIVRGKVIAQYERSMQRGLWTGCYASKNYDEFFADLSMWHFGTAGDPGLISPPPLDGPAWFRKYDADAANLLADIYAGRSGVEIVKWLSLESFPADLENIKKSQNSLTSTQIRIVNKSLMMLKIYWLSHIGERVFYSKIEPGETFSQSTYATHPWLLTDDHDRGVSIFVATDSPGIAIISKSQVDESEKEKHISRTVI